MEAARALPERDGVAVALTGRVTSVIIPISTHSLDDFEELVAAGPARGFLRKSALSTRAIGAVLDNSGSGAPT
ncbi:hypothetical protein EJC51_12980 [Streptomyces aquilus]|uniref:Uncharacterized protein n=1 Tax=Streptomyces aquilus TaxID=2548456 RepID=A0A3S9IFU8_9ACTN|nr:hypothetical protein EJC51_12980 [Streptomyces aquilus]